LNLTQPLSTEVLGKRLCIFRLRKAKNDVPLVITIEGIGQRRRRQRGREVPDLVTIGEPAHARGLQRDVVRPFRNAQSAHREYAHPGTHGAGRHDNEAGPRYMVEQFV
jgi:hypothetical protein